MPPRSNLFTYTTLFRSIDQGALDRELTGLDKQRLLGYLSGYGSLDGKRVYTGAEGRAGFVAHPGGYDHPGKAVDPLRSEEHTSELQSQSNLVCRLLLEK